MEYENKYGGRATAGLTLGVIGTALGALAGGLGNLGFGAANCACSEDHYINRYEAGQSARIAELETEVKLRDANTYTDGKILDLYKYVDGRFNGVEAQICQQNVFNATTTATLNCMSGQIATLMGLTKTVVPITSICPQPATATA